MIWEFGIGRSWGLGLWYQFWLGKTSIVTEFGLFLLQGMPNGGFVVSLILSLCVGGYVLILLPFRSEGC
jgi:hypothetical protein